MFEFDKFYEELIKHKNFNDLPVFKGTINNPEKYENFAILSYNRTETVSYGLSNIFQISETVFNFNFFYNDKEFITEKIQNLENVFDSMNEWVFNITSFLEVPGSFFESKKCYSLSFTIS